MTFLDAPLVAVVVDPSSTGALLAREVHQRGYAVLALWSNCLVWRDTAAGFEFLAEVEEQATVAETLEVLRQSAACLPIAACEAETHFRQLSWQLQLQGRRNREVLLQEYLKGTQYVVDHVSRDGVHKTTMVWVCDRGPANGGYVCFQQQRVTADTAVARQVIAYTRACLDALSITEGATHAEVMMTETGPCLVEVNLRCHGAGGVWMPVARAFAGYTQVDAYVDALGDGAAPFEQLPDVPPSGSKGPHTSRKFENSNPFCWSKNVCTLARA